VDKIARRKLCRAQAIGIPLVLLGSLGPPFFLSGRELVFAVLGMVLATPMLMLACAWLAERNSSGRERREEDQSGTR
jgi:hypothetical protein